MPFFQNESDIDSGYIADNEGEPDDDMANEQERRIRRTSRRGSDSVRILYCFRNSLIINRFLLQVCNS